MVGHTFSFYPLMLTGMASTVQVVDREAQMDKPCGWLEANYWDNVTELDK